VNALPWVTYSTGADPRICVGGGGPTRFLPPFPSFPFSSPLTFPLSPLEVGPLKPAMGLGSVVSSPSGARGAAPAENEFGALQSCQKATSGNHFEYSEYRVLQ